MLFIINNDIRDPYFNLAAEEYFLSTLNGSAVMLWRNAPSVIIGRNQNAYAEVNDAYVRDHGIAVVRRLTGGGAVFHDPGNVNYSFIAPDDGGGIDFPRFMQPVIDALRSLGVEASADGRNDIVASKDGASFKISGNAQCVYPRSDRAMRLHHGTLLYGADLSRMSGALTVNTAKMASKGIKSVRSRVINIAEMISADAGINGVEDFVNYLSDHLSQLYNTRPRSYTDDENAAIKHLRDEKYARWEWNYGESKVYSVEKERRFPFGTVTVRLDANGGIVREMDVSGDFFGVAPVDLLSQAVKGVRYERDAVKDALSAVDIGECISGCTLDDILSLMFD